ncbi:hypothetical protein BD410DRAFT_843261 [Rickenella mellea]|uniref:Uncharacterized protein n=1 Tax=Rickenella mellea TaxID=50990 RepID=A0A4Y7PTX1_9AGAM|nr:hypothetical protein BD410DRAFT_843261 [Rickenella mellea]
MLSFTPRQEGDGSRRSRRRSPTLSLSYHRRESQDEDANDAITAVTQMNTDITAGIIIVEGLHLTARETKVTAHPNVEEIVVLLHTAMEFSKALAGEITTLLTGVGSLHTRKRGLQFEIGELLRMHVFYGPGGQFEPDRMPPSHGPLAHQPPPPDLCPLPPDALPPPAKPTWRSVHQRQTKKKVKDQPPPPQDTLDFLGAPPQRHASWSTWQSNPDFAPTPPEIDTTSHLVPPTLPQCMFGPRSQHSSVYEPH